jgi:phage gp29-like protein
VFEKVKWVLKNLALTRTIAVVNNSDKFSSYPSNGLTPYRLARIFKEADAGDVMRQMELFEEMEEKDPHIFSQLQTRKNAVTGLDYEIIPATDSDYDKDVAEFVKSQIEELESFEDALTDLLDAIGKGIAFTEILWDFRNGKFVAKELKHVHQKHFYWDERDFLRLRTDSEPQGIYIPNNKFIIHRYKAKSGHPSRAGVLRIIAWMYLFKNYDIKDWVSFCEVFGMPLRVGKYDPSASEEDKRALMEALLSLGTDAAGIYPTSTDIEIKESNKQSSADIYERLARFCDEQVSKCILGQTLTSDAKGSYAQSKTHNEVRHDLTVADCKALAATLRRDLITPLVKINFGEYTKVPTIRFDCEESEDLVQEANMYDTLINKIGLKIATSHLYKKFSVPKPEDGEEIASGQKQEISMLANKLQLKGNQGEVDDLVEIAKLESEPIFKKQFKTLKDMTDKCQSLEELKELLEDEEKVYAICKDMKDESFERLLKGSLFNAYLMGRVREDG